MSPISICHHLNCYIKAKTEGEKKKRSVDGKNSIQLDIPPSKTQPSRNILIQIYKYVLIFKGPEAIWPFDCTDSDFKLTSFIITFGFVKIELI